MAETLQTKSSLSLQLTKTAATVVGGFVLYNLWKKLHNPNPRVVIQSLHIYPVKSCRGFQVDSWPISKYGLKHDREWMIYNPKTKRFLTQREVHALALINAELITDNNYKTINGIKLSAPNIKAINVPIETDESDKNKVENITLWEDKVSGIDQGNDVCEWLTKYINNGKQYRLLRISSMDHKRATNAKYTPNHLIGESYASYTDGYPYLITSKASLNALNERLKKRGCNELPMNRFRPNIVIITDLNEAFIEDRISRLILNKLDKEAVTFYVTHPCPRCHIPTINQDSAISHNKEPTLTLRTFRTGKHLGFGKDKHEDVYFGMNAVHDAFDGLSVISKGDILFPVFR